MPESTQTTAMRFATAEPVCSAPYLRPSVLKLAGPLPAGTRVLDVGCGNGYWARLFHSHGCEVVGIDPSESGIAIAREECPAGRFEQMEVHVDMVDRLSERPFDLVISTEVVEHLYDPAVWAAGCFGALRPGGRLIASTPYHGRLKNMALAISGKLDAHHEALRPGGHIKFFSRSTLEQLLTAAGFRDLAFVGAGRLPRMWKSMVLAGSRPGYY